jgi:hypothetical protein
VVDGVPHKKYDCRTLHRWPLRTAYPDIVEDVRVACTRLDRPILVVDGTGVGRAVVDLFRLAGLQVSVFQPISITAGDTVTREEGYLKVPKKDLVGAVEVVMGSDRLKIAKALKLARVLEGELRNFKMKVNLQTGKESFEAWRNKDTDDLTLAMALAVWFGERMSWGMPLPSVSGPAPALASDMMNPANIVRMMFGGASRRGMQSGYGPAGGNY